MTPGKPYLLQPLPDTTPSHLPNSQNSQLNITSPCYLPISISRYPPHPFFVSHNVNIPIHGAKNSVTWKMSTLHPTKYFHSKREQSPSAQFGNCAHIKSSRNKPSDRINKKMCKGISRNFKGKTMLCESNSPVYPKINNQIPSILEYELGISFVIKVYKPVLMPKRKGTFSFCNRPQGE